MAVDPLARRRGVGRALFAELEGVAARESIDQIALDTWHFNQGVQRFFAALGFSTHN
ncbi:MAG TPA: GNAT family N-acetyltransferase, partial [Gemmatimonadetes bacterium]|nr:GNAT family N-acetyltransferase [Gemmatimonadota bacterium]